MAGCWKALCSILHAKAPFLARLWILFQWLSYAISLCTLSVVYTFSLSSTHLDRHEVSYYIRSGGKSGARAAATKSAVMFFMHCECPRFGHCVYQPGISQSASNVLAVGYSLLFSSQIDASYMTNDSSSVSSLSSYFFSFCCGQPCFETSSTWKIAWNKTYFRTISLCGRAWHDFLETSSHSKFKTIFSMLGFGTFGHRRIFWPDWVIP